MSSMITITIPFAAHELSYMAFSDYIISRIITTKSMPSNLVISISSLHDVRFMNDKIRSKLYYYIEHNEESIEVEIDGLKLLLETKEPCPTNKYYVSDGEPHIHGDLLIRIESSDLSKFEELMRLAVEEFGYKINKIETDKDELVVYVPSHDRWTVLTVVPKRTIESIYLPNKDKSEVLDVLNNFLKPETKALYHRLNITYKKTFLFEGVPGSGKTSFIRAIASSIGYNIGILNFHNKLDDTGLLELLIHIPKDTIVVLEDMDCLFQSRKANDSDKNSITLSGILNALDGVATKYGLIVIITTNYKDKLDPALVRPGRVDYIMKFDYINSEQLTEIFRKFMFEIELDVLAPAEEKFISEVQKLKIKLTPSLITQYLFQYVNKPKEAISKLKDMKSAFLAAKIEKTTDDTEMYN